MMYNPIFTAFLAVGLLLAVTGCSDDRVSSSETADPPSLSPALFESNTDVITRRAPANPDRSAYFGDLHVHTTNSFDAYQFGTLATPHDAYRFAKGEAIDHPAGFPLQLKRPLDFYAVTDHAQFMGVAGTAADTNSSLSKYDVAKPFHNINAPDNLDTGLLSINQRLKTFSTFLENLTGAIENGTISRREVLDIGKSAWKETIDAAQQHYEPGRFTTFIGYEYTSVYDDIGSLHRNVIFEGSDNLPAEPFSKLHSRNPENLWQWMDLLRKKGVESLAIPHNSNDSNGHMFELTDWDGNPIDSDYAAQRMRNEPLVEITQIKGTSETHPALSNRDEWAGFELKPFKSTGSGQQSQPAGSYVRDALRRGLALESKGSRNPYAFGFIGSSDTHTGASQNDEANFSSKLGLLSATETSRGSVPWTWLKGTALSYLAPKLVKEVDGEIYTTGAAPTFGASGLAGVWAEENTRESIFSAFRRKETYATSGPRIRLRVFGGFNFTDAMINAPDVIAQAYQTGFPMGSTISQKHGKLGFLLVATADPEGAPLQRLQMIKGWVDASGKTHEQVIDVACAGDRKIEPKTLRCPDNGARVDISDCSINADSGVKELRTIWHDPDFDPNQRAFYYARVLENPTCRWSTWDAIRVGVKPRSDFPTTLQERAWSSPIQYLPQS